MATIVLSFMAGAVAGFALCIFTIYKWGQHIERACLEEKESGPRSLYDFADRN